MCNNKECGDIGCGGKCGNVPVVGKVYQSKGEPGFRVNVLFVGMQKVLALVVSRGIVARTVDEEISLSIKNFGDGHWVEYKEPKVETHSLFVKKNPEQLWITDSADSFKYAIIGRIVVTVTDDVLTSVEIVK